jgi:hypothetical protein
MRLFSVLFACSLVFAAATAHAGAPVPETDPKPRTGWVGIGVGIGGFVWTVGQAISVPLCFAEWYPADTDICLATTAVLASGALAVGISGIVIGKKRRNAYKAWKQRQLERNRVGLDDVAFGYAAEHAQLALRFRF